MKFNSRFLSFPLAALSLIFAISCEKPEPPVPSGPDEPDEPEPPVAEAPVLKAEPAVFNAQGGTYQLPVTVQNPVEGESVKAALVEQAEWISFGTPGKDGVPVILKDNLSAPRTAKVDLTYKGAEKVTVEVTQKQWEFSEFGIAISNVGPFGATFDITRKAGYHGGYFFEVIDKKAFDKYVANESASIGDFAYGDAIYQSDLAYLNNLAEKHGHPLADLFKMIPGLYSKEDAVKMSYSGLAVDTDYIFIVYGMEEGTAVRKTPMCFYEFRTGYSSESALSFTGEATDVTENYAEITVTPSNNTEYWYMDWVSEIQLESTTIADVMQKSITNAKSLLSRYKAEEILCHGPETIQASDLMPGTTYTVVAWGMNLEMAATTAPVEVFTFKTKDFDIIDDCTFKIDVLEIQDMDVKVKVTPSNLNTRYYVAFVEKSKMAGYTDEQAAQRIINMEASRISNHYYDIENLSWANLPGLEAGVREIWGRRDEGWTFQPRHDYIIYVFGIDNFGIRSTGVGRIDVTTGEPTASSNYFSVTFDKVTWQGADYTITPEIADEYWMPFLIETAELAPYRNADGSLKESEVMHEIEEYYEDEIIYNTYTGTRKLHSHVIPDTQYTLLVFGYSGTNTTKIYEWPVYVPKPPFDKSSADFTYSFELFRGEDLAALDPKMWPHADNDGDCVMIVKIQPNADAVHWYWGLWAPLENYIDQGGKYYLMTLDMDPTVANAGTDKKNVQFRPWWYGAGENYQWVDADGDIVDHWPWSISGWAEGSDGNYGPWHYDLIIPVPVPKGQETGKYEVGYTEAYNFWSSPAQTQPMKVYKMSTGKEVKF
jgi:hypothetical protein